jgi:alkylation response protein AidB-like acyl-CoA dehydrogenase
MFIELTPEQKAFKEEIRAYLKRLVTKEVIDEVRSGPGGGGPLYHEVLTRMGKDGWLGISWPKQYGGLERTAVEQYIFFDEVQRSGFALPFLTLNTVGPTLMKFGTDAQRAQFLPRILRGDCHFSIGYTEPNAGTDLASLVTRAERDGDHFVINGQKVFTSLASYADYIWLAVRTDPTAPKHKGISMFIVDVKTPGVQITPIHTLGGHPTYATYYENVRVHESCLVGQLNGGWKLITNQLNHERVALSSFGHTARHFEETLEWAKTTRLASGQRVIDLPWVQSNLAKVHVQLDTLRLFCFSQAAQVDKGELHPAESSAVKVFGTEAFMQVYKLLLEVAGAAGTLREGSPGAVLGGWLEVMYRGALVLTFGGGTNEAQRDIIAMAALGMPREPR